MESPLPPNLCPGQLASGSESVNRDRGHIKVCCQLSNSENIRYRFHRLSSNYTQHPFCHNFSYDPVSLVICKSLKKNAKSKHYMTTVPPVGFALQARLAMSGDYARRT